MATPKTIVTSTAFKNRVGEFQDKALAGPVLITKNGREHTVLLSAAEYQRLRRRDRQVPLAEELETLEAISKDGAAARCRTPGVKTSTG